MNKLYFNKEINCIPLLLKSILWEFVRTDLSIKDFEPWLYSAKELEYFLTEDSYGELLSFNFKECSISEVQNLRLVIYNLLVQFKESCLCLVFPTHTSLLTPHKNETESFFYSQIESLKSILRIQKFSGSQEGNLTYIRPAELCRCLKCNEYWFRIQDDDNDTSIIRLKKPEAELIKKDNSWPNENWPSALKNWSAFSNIHFKYVTEIYPTWRKPFLI